MLSEFSVNPISPTYVSENNNLAARVTAEGLFEQICLRLLSRLFMQSQDGQQMTLFWYNNLMCLPWNMLKSDSVNLEQISISNGNHEAAYDQWWS